MHDETMNQADGGDVAAGDGSATPQATPGVARRRRWAGDDRGDVPGWVLITLMTAGLVVALWAVAGPLLANLFETSIASVTGPE